MIYISNGLGHDLHINLLFYLSELIIKSLKTVFKQLKILKSLKNTTKTYLKPLKNNKSLKNQVIKKFL